MSERFQLWKRPICLDQQMHVDSFAKLSETLNCYIKKYYMKWNTGIIVKIVFFFGNQGIYIKQSQHNIAQGPVLVQNLLHPRPVRTYNKSEDTSTSGVSKRTKGCWRWSAILASWSAHAFASLKQCFSFHLGIRFIKILQSSTKGA